MSYEKINLNEASRMTGLTESEIRRLVASNSIPHEVVGKKIYFPLKELMIWNANRLGVGNE